MKSKHSDIEALTIRRASVADTDKVRYRVYSSPTEFIAVIAESALMAVKVSGVKKPHKIIRDLPSEGIAIEAKKMAAIDTAAARIALPLKQLDKRSDRLVTEIKDIDPKAKQALFKPMNIGDLQSKSTTRARILPPELLTEIIEQHAKAATPAPEPEPPAAEPEHMAPAPAPESVMPPPPEASPQERVVEAAHEVIPPSAPQEPGVLTPEEVERLLNG